MTAAVQTVTTTMSTDMTYYAGDPVVLKPDRYTKRMEAILSSERADQLVARIAIHAQLRDAFSDADVQKKLQPFLSQGESMDTYVKDAKARAKFFSDKQNALQKEIIKSSEQAALKEAHGELAAWENTNAVLLRHPMFMNYAPSQALLLESAATVALYRQYATMEEGEYTSESSDGEVPAMLVKMGGNPKPYFTQAEKPFEVDEHSKMYSQQVLQNKRVEYEQLRAKVATLRRALETSSAVVRLEELMAIRSDIFKQFGIDRLVSLCSRKDRELGFPNEGGLDAQLKGHPATDELVASSRCAQYSLPKIAEAAYRNFQSTMAMDDWDAMMKNTGHDARQIIEALKPLKDEETFRYWFLSCLTADTPQLGPNKIVGKNTTVLEDYRKFWAPQKSSYVPSLNTANRTTFMNKVANGRGLPHIVVLAPATYKYRENNDPNSISTGTVDLMVYDMTNEKVLLMVVDSAEERRPRGAYLNAQESRFRFAAVVRSAISYDNQYHGFECTGTVAEYFFDAEQGPEENYYCVMAPSKLYQKQPMTVQVPVTAFRPFTSCPPRYFVLGDNWGVSTNSKANPYPASFAHIELNECAVAACDALPAGFVTSKVLPQLPTREDGLAKLEEEKKKQEQERAAAPQPTPRSARTPRTGRPSQAATSNPLGYDPAEILAQEQHKGLAESEDPLGPIVAADALAVAREQVMKSQRQWHVPAFMATRSKDAFIKGLPAVKDGSLRTPLNVFNDMMQEKHGVEQPLPSAPQSARGARRSEGAPTHKNTERQAANVAWF